MVPACPHCMEDRYKDVENSENRSVASHRSNKSSRSVRSSRSVKSPSRSIKSSSRGSNKKKAVPKCPFDEKGYCHVHAHIRLARWKILQEFCIECANEDEDNQTTCSRSSRMSRKSSSSSRRSRRRSSSSKSQRSRRSSSSYCKDEEVYSQISSQSEKSKSKKTPSRREKTSSENPKKSKDVGRVQKKSSSSKSNVSSTPEKKNAVDKQTKQKALSDYKKIYNNDSTVVKNMIFTDVYADKGRYTGEVNAKKLPHGRGELTYDHGLVQHGNWVSSYIKILLLFSSILPYAFIYRLMFITGLCLDKWSIR